MEEMIVPMSAGYYDFFKNMWIMHRLTEAQMRLAVTKGYLTPEEFTEIKRHERTGFCI